MKKKEVLKKYNLEKYLQYADSEEAYAVLFVKKYLNSSKNMWVDILHVDCPYHYDQTILQFKQVECELFPRTIKPKYPPKADFQDDEDYYYICRAITWETAHKDIKNQRNKGVKGKVYTIEGVRYYDAKKKEPSYFIDSAPNEIKALLINRRDFTNPLWDEAVKYINEDYSYFDWYSYKIKNIKRVH